MPLSFNVLTRTLPPVMLTIYSSCLIGTLRPWLRTIPSDSGGLLSVPLKLLHYIFFYFLKHPLARRRVFPSHAPSFCDYDPAFFSAVFIAFSSTTLRSFSLYAQLCSRTMPSTVLSPSRLPQTFGFKTGLPLLGLNHLVIGVKLDFCKLLSWAISPALLFSVSIGFAVLPFLC